MYRSGRIIPIEAYRTATRRFWAALFAGRSLFNPLLCWRGVGRRLFHGPTSVIIVVEALSGFRTGICSAQFPRIHTSCKGCSHAWTTITGGVNPLTMMSPRYGNPGRVEYLQYKVGPQSHCWLKNKYPLERDADIFHCMSTINKLIHCLRIKLAIDLYKYI